jgi:hypothetical protein
LCRLLEITYGICRREHYHTRHTQEDCQHGTQRPHRSVFRALERDADVSVFSALKDKLNPPTEGQLLLVHTLGDLFAIAGIWFLALRKSADELNLSDKLNASYESSRRG